MASQIMPGVRRLRIGLRLVFAYRPDWERSRELVTALKRDVLGGFRPEVPTSVQGKTVLVIGNRGEGDPFPWGYFKCWAWTPIMIMIRTLCARVGAQCNPIHEVLAPEL